MIEVKICGITNPADARLAADCGANALGFIFYPKSPRYVTPKKAKWIAEQIPKSVIRVGVFVNQQAEGIKVIARFCGLHLIQLHGDECPEFCRNFESFRLIKAFAPQDPGDLERLKDFRIRGILIDARRPGVYGGTGERADWILARKAGETQPLILAGGLGEDNVAEAIRTVSPRALDLNSGLESSPGKKDPGKIKKVMDLIHSLQPVNPATGTSSLFSPGLLRK
jgi:phosphoribosylanthranilate isomerase